MYVKTLAFINNVIEVIFHSPDVITKHLRLQDVS